MKLIKGLIASIFKSVTNLFQVQVLNMLSPAVRPRNNSEITIFYQIFNLNQTFLFCMLVWHQKFIGSSCEP